MKLIEKYDERSKKIITAVLFVLLGFALLCVCSCALDSIRPENADKIRVAVIENDGIVIETANYVDVTPGKAADFTVKLKDGYIYEGNSAGAYYDPETGMLKLSVVKYPTSIEFYLTNTNNMMKLELFSPLSSMVSHNGSYSYFNDGESVTVTAKEDSTYDFLGWSTSSSATAAAIVR